VLLLAQGTPMLLMGDEVRRTQRGNNNPYCQDNETSWLDWSQVVPNADLLRFVQLFIRYTQWKAIFREERFWTAAQDGKFGQITWHGVKLNQPDWSPDSHSVAFMLYDAANDERMHVMLNAYWEPLEFELPPLPQRLCWGQVVDTALPTPGDILEPGQERRVGQPRYRVEARSAVVLEACSASKTA
jgi:glycogen operon protein